MARRHLTSFDQLFDNAGNLGLVSPYASRGGVRRRGCGLSFRRPGSTSTQYSQSISPSAVVMYERFYIRVRRTPTTGDAMVFRVHSPTAQKLLRVRLTTAGDFAFINRNDGTIVTQAYTLNQWYRIETKVDTSNPTWNIAIRIDGTEIFNGQSGTSISFVNVGQVQVGCESSVDIGADEEYDVDDLAGDDATWVGESRVRLLLPAGVGTHNDFAQADWRAQRYLNASDVGTPPMPAQSATNPSRQTYLFDLNDISNLGTVLAYQMSMWTRNNHTVDICIRLNGTTTDVQTGHTTSGGGRTKSNVITATLPQAGDTVEWGIEKTAGSGTLNLDGIGIEIEVTGDDTALATEETDTTVRTAVGTYSAAPVTQAITPFGAGIDPDFMLVWAHSTLSQRSLAWCIGRDDRGQHGVEIPGAATQVYDQYCIVDGALCVPSGSSLNRTANGDYGYLAIRDRQNRMMHTTAVPVSSRLGSDDVNVTFASEASGFGIESAIVQEHDGTNFMWVDTTFSGGQSKPTGSTSVTDRVQSIGTGTLQIGSTLLSAIARNLSVTALRRQFASNALWDLVSWVGDGTLSRDIPVPVFAGQQLDLVIGIPKGNPSIGIRSRYMSSTVINAGTSTSYISQVGVGQFTVSGTSGGNLNANGAFYSAWVFAEGIDTADVEARITQAVVQVMSPNVTTCPQPAEGEDLCVTIDDPILFGSWAPGDDARYWFAETSLDDPDSYYGGWKDDRLVSVSEIRRALSSTNYEYEVGNFSIELADEDYFVRSKLGVAPTSYYPRREVEVYAVTPEGRADQVVAKKLAAGFVDRDPTYDDRGASMTVRLACRDRIGASMGWTTAGQQKLPRRVVTQINLPGAGVTALGKGAPIPYGRISTAIQPSGSPVVTIPVPSGLTAECAFFEGTPPSETWQAGFGPMVGGPAAPTSPVLTVQAGGELSLDVPGSRYYAVIFPVDSAGQFGDPAPFCNTGLNDVVTSGNQQIEVTWAASPGAASYAVYLGTFFYDVDFHQWIGTAGTSAVFTRNPEFGVPATPENITPGAFVAGEPTFWYYKIRALNGDFRSELNPIDVFGISAPQLANGEGWRPVRIRWKTAGSPSYEVLRRGALGDYDRMWVVSSGQFNNGLHYFDDDFRDTNVIYLGGGIPAQPTGAMNVIYAGREVLPDQQEWGRLLIAGCAIQGVDDWYYTQDTEDFLTEINAGDGTDFLFPKEDTAWFNYFAVRYRDILGSDGTVRRWTFGYVRGDKLAMIEAGSGSVTINIRGVESDGGGTGSLLTDIHDQFRHFLRTQVIVSGEGYLTGQWDNQPRFGDDAICTIDDEAFEELRNMRKVEFNGEGITGAGIVGANGEQAAMSEEIRRWGTSMEARIGANRFWQITIAAIDENLSASGIATLTDEHDIHRRTFKPMPRQSELWNVHPYRYARNYVTNGWNVDGQQEINDDSISRYRFRQESAPVEFHYLRDPATVAFMIGKRSRRLADIPTYVSLEGSLCLTGEAYDVGQYIRVDHWRGVQMNGWSHRPLWVLSNTINPSTRRVRLECLDVTRLVPSGVSA